MQLVLEEAKTSVEKYIEGCLLSYRRWKIERFFTFTMKKINARETCSISFEETRHDSRIIRRMNNTTYSGSKLQLPVKGGEFVG